MKRGYRRKHFFIKKPLQLRYMAYILTTLIVVLLVTLISVYYGIWGGILKAFSEENVRSNVETAVRIKDYEAARIPQKEVTLESLRFFKETDLLSAQQRDTCNRILTSTNKELHKQLLDNPAIEMCFYDDVDDLQIRFRGTAELIQDPKTTEQIINESPALKPWIEGK